MAEIRNDPLAVYGRRFCHVCGNHRRKRKNCEHCRGAGFERADLANHWAPRPAFLVGGGPSLADMDYGQLATRGVASLAVNNVAGLVPVRAHVFGDPQVKFHHGLFLDPNMMTFCPIGKMRYGVRAKLPGKWDMQDEDGNWPSTGRNGQASVGVGLECQVWQCPNTWGFARSTKFEAAEFLTTEYAHWGQSAKAVADHLKGVRRIFSMLLAIRLLHYLGCPRIYMIGVDFYTPRSGSYAFPEITNPGNRGYDKVTAMLTEIKPVLDAAGFSIYNSNPTSRCEVFDYVPFDLALADCRGPVPREPWDLSQWYVKSIEEEFKRQQKANKRKVKPMTLDELAAVQEAVT
ncbi:MAG: hypothetical protein ACYTG0_25085 [Planctomycetota bacterium]|jgi:hypothetical protein